MWKSAATVEGEPRSGELSVRACTALGTRGKHSGLCLWRPPLTCQLRFGPLLNDGLSLPFMRSLLKDISYFFVKVDAFALSKEWLLLLFIATLEARIESYEVKLFRGLNSPPEDIHHTTASLAILYYFILLHFSTVPRVTANHFLSPAPPSFTFF